MSLFSSNEENFCTPFAIHNQTNTLQGQIDKDRLEPENEIGNVEYKLRLTDPTPERIEKLVTQLKWRIREGNGEAIVFLGVRDDGIFVGLTPEEKRLSIQTLECMTAKIGAKMTIVKEKVIHSDDVDPKLIENIARHSSAATAELYHESCHVGRKNSQNDENLVKTRGKKVLQSSRANKKKYVSRKVIQVLVKRKTHDISDELRIAVLGPTGCGKSSLLGVLTRGERDNGRGSARLNLFRHRHEVRSGHTSSISQEILGFDSHGTPLTYETCLSSEEIVEAASRIVTLIDLAGHQRYLNTTLFGLGSYSPDLVLLVINAMSPISATIIEHMSLALGMFKSLAIVINKIDLVPIEILESRCHEIMSTLNTLDANIIPSRVNAQSDATSMATQFRDSRTVPIFLTSCISGAGLNALYAFFYEMSPKLSPNELNNAISKPAVLQVDETFEIPGIGTVVSGLLVEGVIREGDEMLIGPDDFANFSKVSIVSLQRHKIPCNLVRAGQKCTMAISTISGFNVRRGMVMKEIEQKIPSACLQFEVKVRFINSKVKGVSRGSQVSIYVANVKQTCIVESAKSLNDNNWLLDLRLIRRPEYIRVGTGLIMKLATSKAVGHVHSLKKIVD